MVSNLCQSEYYGSENLQVAGHILLQCTMLTAGVERYTYQWLDKEYREVR